MDHEERLKAALADRYQIEGEIGSGGMATVYLAQDLKHDRQVAVKVLKPELAQSLGPERFLREIKTAANLTHPHILPVHDSGEADGFLFFVMPFVEGESLRSRLTKERQLPAEDAVQITREIADALAYAHEKGVVHRDVKPANIMLDAGHAVLTDFGVAYAVAEAKDDRITRTGTSLGTPAYMSPEQATGEQELDGRSDQYALGCVLFEMLAGHPPFTGVQADAVIRQHITENPPSVTRARPSATEEVAQVIIRSLSKSPADRYRTTGEMAAALAFTTAPEKQERKGKPRGVTLALGAVAVLIVVGAAFWALDPGTEPNPSIAVLPFQNLSGIEEDAYFTDGMHGEVITKLSKISGLSVRGQTSVSVYRESPKNNRQIGEDLNARYILRGGVQRAGETVRINVQLLEASTDENVWADVFDRAMSVENLLSIQAEIVDSVAASVRAVVTPEELARIEAQPTQNLEAYDHYLRGRRHLHRRTEEGFRQAVEAFELAIEQDSAFGPAYAGLATVLALSPMYDYPSLPEPYSAASRALSLADSALSLGPSLAEAYAARVYVKMYLWFPFEEVLTDAEQAIRFEPSYADAHGWYAHILAMEGQIEESIRQDSIAITLDPLAPGRRIGFAANTVFGGRLDHAIREADRALALDPNLWMAEALKTLSLLILDRPGQCAEFDVGPYAGLTAMCLYSQGEVAEASAMIDSLSDAVLSGAYLDSNHGLANVAASIATYHAWVGDASESLAWFERSTALSPTTILFWTISSGISERIRNDEDFWTGIEALKQEARWRVEAGG